MTKNHEVESGMVFVLLLRTDIFPVYSALNRLLGWKSQKTYIRPKSDSWGKSLLKALADVRPFHSRA